MQAGVTGGASGIQVRLGRSWVEVTFLDPGPALAAPLELIPPGQVDESPLGHLLTGLYSALMGETTFVQWTVSDGRVVRRWELCESEDPRSEHLGPTSSRRAVLLLRSGSGWRPPRHAHLLHRARRQAALAGGLRQVHRIESHLLAAGPDVIRSVWMGEVTDRRNDNTDVLVELDDGRRFAFTAFTPGALSALMQSESSGHLVIDDLLVISELTEANARPSPRCWKTATSSATGSRRAERLEASTVRPWKPHER
ncbi:MAG: hypothetical protein HY319_04265 [Armatimonadetes bacterium]|nr:hypothetical protein [Armatimonadota bacterium]